jgi:hypothetical protein
MIGNKHQAEYVTEYADRRCTVIIQALRNEDQGSWDVTVREAGRRRQMLHGSYPANFHTDKRTAKEFIQDLMVCALARI